jgi:hypothetical protein
MGIKTTVIATVLTATAVALIGVAAPAHADDAPVNLPVTDAVRAELVQAGAVLTGRPAAEFGGLRPGLTYYAYDPASGMHWAAAALTAPTTFDASIQLQDQNSYLMFAQAGTPGATWIPTAAGFGPIPAGQASCPVPQSVRNLWAWPAGACYPPPGLR